MGLGPLAGTTWGSVVTVAGYAALFGAAAVGGVHVAVSVAGYAILWAFGMLS